MEGGNVLACQISMRYLNPRLIQYYVRFRKTDGRHIGIFYFRFRFRHTCSHRHAILHQPAEFRTNRTIDGGVITLYSFFNTAAIELVHELILKRGPKFRVCCTPVLPRFFCRFLLFSISIFYFNLFPASESVRLAWKQHVLMVLYGAEFDMQKVLYKTHLRI